MFVVTVDFSIHPDQMDAFIPLMLANAQNSLDLEEHCLQFDVCFASDNENQVFLYEIYRSQQDFEAHLLMPHFLEFNAKTASYILTKKVKTFYRKNTSNDTHDDQAN